MRKEKHSAARNKYSYLLGFRASLTVKSASVDGSGVGKNGGGKRSHEAKQTTDVINVAMVGMPMLSPGKASSAGFRELG
jgi:hypothetical protein